jgi:hypothetical protein
VRELNHRKSNFVGIVASWYFQTDPEGTWRSEKVRHDEPS